MNTFKNKEIEKKNLELKNFHITSKGYKIPLDNPMVNELKKELFVQPYCENPVRFPIFRISDKFLYVPKYYGINKFGLPNLQNIKEQNGLSVDINFTSKLRDYQIETCNKILLHLKKNQSGLVSVYTGWGKTCAALWIASELKVKTLIIVHTENLLQQWKERINDFLGITNDEIGVIQGPKVDTHNKKICIGMIQSISMKDYPVCTFKEFGLTLLDEVHHTPGRIFSKIFYKIGTKYNLGLSATLTRSDGLTKVIKYFLGDTIVSLKLSILNPTIIVKFTNIDPLEEKRMVNGKANIPGMINDLCDSFARNLEIVNLIKDKYNEGRKILVLSDRRNHCNELKRLLEATIHNSENEIGLYYGGMKNAALQESNKKRIIIATYQIASEGYDNKELDTLVFSTPKSNIEQAIGRILRQENEHEPEVIDFVDAWSVFNNLYFSRSKFYKKKKYNISGDIKRNENHEQNIKLDKCVIVDEE
jgi:superfamily II DNA or RNA helicase